MVGETRENTEHIAIDNGSGLTKDNARDGAGGVSANAQERGQIGKILRDLSAVRIPYRLCRAVQKPGAAVVAKTLPSSQDVLLRGVGKSADGGEPSHETSETVHHPGHLGLLEHEFADQGSISGALRPPWQGSRRGGVPRLEKRRNQR